jgi:hypothetical protein
MLRKTKNATLTLHQPKGVVGWRRDSTVDVPCPQILVIPGPTKGRARPRFIDPWATLNAVKFTKQLHSQDCTKISLEPFTADLGTCTRANVYPLDRQTANCRNHSTPVQRYCSTTLQPFQLRWEYNTFAFEHCHAGPLLCYTIEDTFQSKAVEIVLTHVSRSQGAF